MLPVRGAAANRPPSLCKNTPPLFQRLVPATRILSKPPAERSPRQGGRQRPNRRELAVVGAASLAETVSRSSISAFGWTFSGRLLAHRRRPDGQRMQAVDRPAHVQGLAQPARGRGLRVQPKSLRLVPRSKDLDGIAAHLRRWRDLGQEPPVRAAEAKLAVGLSRDLIALLVDRAMVPATQQGEIRQRGWAAVRPVTDVMALAEPNPAAREAATAVAMVERSP